MGGGGGGGGGGLDLPSPLKHRCEVSRCWCTVLCNMHSALYHQVCYCYSLRRYWTLNLLCVQVCMSQLSQRDKQGDNSHLYASEGKGEIQTLTPFNCLTYLSGAPFWELTDPPLPLCLSLTANPPSHVGLRKFGQNSAKHLDQVPQAELCQSPPPPPPLPPHVPPSVPL